MWRRALKVLTPDASLDSTLCEGVKISGEGLPGALVDLQQHLKLHLFDGHSGRGDTHPCDKARCFLFFLILLCGYDSVMHTVDAGFVWPTGATRMSFV